MKGVGTVIGSPELSSSRLSLSSPLRLTQLVTTMGTTDEVEIWREPPLKITRSPEIKNEMYNLKRP